jgi:hypothetical protein
VAYNSFLIMNLMRILTPEEINDLTTKYCGEKRVSLTSLMTGVEEVESEEEQSTAKILPFNHPEQNLTIDAESKTNLNAGENVKGLISKLYGIKPNSMASLMLSSSRQEDIKISQKKSSSIFILEQKEKLVQNQRKLQGREVIKTYRKVSAVDLDIERGHQDDLSWSASHGLLVNKKQA